MSMAWERIICFILKLTEKLHKNDHQHHVIPYNNLLQRELWTCCNRLLYGAYDFGDCF